MITFLLLTTLVAFATASSRVNVGRAPDCFHTESCTDWKRKGPATMENVIELSFAVSQKNTELLDTELMAVSDPSSASYGKHWTFEQVNEFVEDSNARIGLIEYLTVNGVTDIEVSPNRAYVNVKMFVAHAESLFATEFHEYVHTVSGQVLTRALAYSLPEIVADCIDYVEGLSNFPQHIRHGFVSEDEMKLEVSANTAASGYATLDVLNSAYGIKDNVVTNAGATQSLFESLNQYYSQDDLDKFCTEYGVPSQTISRVVGTNDGSVCATDINNCAEANLDVQYILGIAQEANTTFWSVSSTTSFGTWIQSVGNDADAPLVHSISYGSYEEYTSTSEASRFNTEAQKLGLRGITVVVSSGDDGVANFQARDSASSCGYHPSWPASSPYVVAVGATYGVEYGTTEVVCSSDIGGVITSGGGFSSKFSTPSWQSSAVADYLAKSVAASGYNANGRGYPDVALAGHNYPVVIGQNTYLLSGTSASSPVFAALLTLVNNERLNNGKSAVGFANPAIYSIYNSDKSAFNDVVSGSNKCTADATICCSQGFSADIGWDPITGLGSVNFNKFKSLYAAL